MSFFDNTSCGLFTNMMGLDGLRLSLQEAVMRAMPDNTLEDEFTEAVLFVLSIRLNRLTGGAHDMKFSARCHQTTTQARLLPVRLVWRAMGAVIDLYCAAFRGEVAHCETAWFNHCNRGTVGQRRHERPLAPRPE